MGFTTLAIDDPSGLVFGRAPHPVETPRGLVVGGGTVYPELNFTLGPVKVDRQHLSGVCRTYREIAEGALTRAVQMGSGGLFLEFETLIEMTREPDIGVAVVETLREVCDRFHARDKLAVEIRLTPNDLREFERPPRMATSALLEPMWELFERGALAGGDFLSIESTGGKEIADDALMRCDLQAFVFSQAVLGVRDVGRIWRRISGIARGAGCRTGGDTACAFGNTAMVLAGQGFIPKVFAAIARVATVVRTLAAVEAGASGPDKDCGYEGPYLKAIAGIPISMEGRMAACAHSSPVGNIAAACADLWSNESVQHVKLLGDWAPTVSLEQLEYDARLMNTATLEGRADVLRGLFVASDRAADPQAFVLDPEVVVPVCRRIVAARNPVAATRDACLEAVRLMGEAQACGHLFRDAKEDGWLDTMRADLEDVPGDEESFVERMLPRLDPSRVLLHEYGL